MIDLWADWCTRYPICSIEDGLGEEDNTSVGFPSGTIFKWMEEGMIEKTIDVNTEETEVEINYC